MRLHGHGQQDLLAEDEPAVLWRRAGQRAAQTEIALGGAGALDDLEIDKRMDVLESEEDVRQQR